MALSAIMAAFLICLKLMPEGKREAGEANKTTSRLSDTFFVRTEHALLNASHLPSLFCIQTGPAELGCALLTLLNERHFQALT